MKKMIIALLIIWSWPGNADDHHSGLVHSNPLPEINMSIEEIGDIFMGRITKWRHSNENITVVTRPVNSIEHKVFVSDILGVSLYRYRKTLSISVYSGRSFTHIEVSSNFKIMDYMSGKPYSVSYVDEYAYIVLPSGVSRINVIN